VTQKPRRDDADDLSPYLTSEEDDGSARAPPSAFDDVVNATPPDGRAQSAASSPPPGGRSPSNRIVSGFDPSEAVPTPRAARQSKAAAEVDQALVSYNEAAARNRWTQCRTLTPARARRLDRRLREIGGIEAFRRALSAIPRHDFLSGRVKPKEGRDPFKLDIDVLLQTGGKMGDVLAHLIDMAADDVVPARPTASADLPDNWWSNQAAVKAIGIEGWRSLVSRRPAGPWQVRKLGPPPGSSGCLVPPEIVQEFRLIEHYTSGGSAR
jgi:hypothetical protein